MKKNISDKFGLSDSFTHFYVVMDSQYNVQEQKYSTGHNSPSACFNSTTAGEVYYIW
jgi:hypothetical protein